MLNQNRAKVWLPFVLVLVLASIIATRAGRETNESQPYAQPSANPVLADAVNSWDSINMPSTQVTGPVQNIRFTLYDAGIFPRTHSVKRGVVAVALEDRTGRSAGLSIQQRVGESLVPIVQVARFQNHWRGRERLTLAPGNYTVLDLSRPRNRATLVVEP